MSPALQGLPPAASDAIALRDVLELPTLRQARVLAGEAGLDRLVRSVNVMEVPDIINWVRADELLLTTAYPLRDDRAGLLELVPRLAEKNLAGIALKPARYIDTIPDRMLEAADRLSFPLIELPPEASFNDIISSILTVILDTQAVRLQRAAAIHDRFTSIVLSGGGLRQIAEALADLIGAPVGITDAQGKLQTRSHAASFGDLPTDTLSQLVGSGAGTGAGSGAGADGARLAATSVALDGQPAIVRPIRVGADLYGAVVALADAAELTDDQLEAVEYAATVAALRQVQARVVAEADRRFQTVCLEELVTGHTTDRSALMERATAFNWDLAVPRAVLVAQLEELAGRPFAELAGSAEETAARHRLAEAARVALGADAIIWERSAEVAALVALGAGSRGDLGAAGAALQAEVSQRLPGAVVDVGIGRVRADPLELHGSYAEARRALSIGRWAHGQGHVAVFDELGLDRFLVSAPDAEIEAFCGATVGPLEEYDKAHRTNLVDTLECFLATRNAALAARQLYLHYNTLKNRLARIEEILGPFLDDSERCLSLSLALRLRRLPRG